MGPFAPNYSPAVIYKKNIVAIVFLPSVSVFSLDFLKIRRPYERNSLASLVRLGSWVTDCLRFRDMGIEVLMDAFTSGEEGQILSRGENCTFRFHYYFFVLRTCIVTYSSSSWNYVPTGT